MKTHGSLNGGLVDAIHVVIPIEERFSSVRRTNFAKALARAVKHFIDDRYSCGRSGIPGGSKASSTVITLVAVSCSLELCNPVRNIRISPYVQTHTYAHNYF